MIIKIVIRHDKKVVLFLFLTQHEHTKNVNKQFEGGQNDLIDGLKAKIEEFALRTPKELKTSEYP